MRRIILFAAVVMLVAAGFYLSTLRAQQQVLPELFVKPPFQRSQDIKDEIERNHLENLKYRGTDMAPAVDKAGDALQEAISAAFDTQDPKPAGRAQEFTYWLSDTRVKHIGWFGIIKSVDLGSDDTAIVKVRMAPQLLTPEGGPAFTPDYCIETWEYSNGKLKFLKSERPEGVSDMLILD